MSDVVWSQAVTAFDKYAPPVTVNEGSISIEAETQRGRGYETVVAAVPTEYLLRRMVMNNDVRRMMMQTLLDFDRRRPPYVREAPRKRIA